LKTHTYCGGRMPVIHIPLSPEEHEKAKRAKGSRTWTEFFTMLLDMYLKSGESEGTTQEDIDYLRYRITDLENRLLKLEEGEAPAPPKQLYEKLAQIEERLRTLESVVAGKISEKYEGEKGESTPFTTADKLAKEKEESESRPRVRRGDLPATKKQIRYMRALMMETKVPVDEVIKQTGVDITRDESEITREEASRVIDYLEGGRNRSEKTKKPKSEPKKAQGKGEEAVMVPASEEQVRELKRLVAKAAKAWNISEDDVMLQATRLTGVTSIATVDELDMNLLTEEEADKLISWLKERV